MLTSGFRDGEAHRQAGQGGCLHALLIQLGFELHGAALEGVPQGQLVVEPGGRPTMPLLRGSLKLSVELPRPGTQA